MNRTRLALAHVPRRLRRGVTLVELIVAVIILSVGLLAIVGSSGAIARGLGESRLDNLAAYAAESRLERLSGSACSGLTLGSWVTETSRGITETYAVTDVGNNVREITDSVSWSTRRGTRRQAFTTRIPCRTGA
jgi:prepilin-type N-terminal cleavage/methylation domain-containing protein